MSDLVELVAYEHEQVSPEVPEGAKPLWGRQIINLGEVAVNNLVVVIPGSSIGTMGRTRPDLPALKVDVITPDRMENGVIVALAAVKLGRYNTNQAIAIHIEETQTMNWKRQLVSRAKLFPPSEEELDLAYEWLWPNE